MIDLERCVEQFEARNAQVLSISCDSIHAHNAWADHLGGISFPMLSDWHPKGQVSGLYGVYDAERGNPIRSVFIIDPNGVVRWQKVYPAGQGLPTASDLLAEIARL